LLTDPTNQHESFQRVLSSLARLPRNFPVGHPSKDYSKSSTLNCGVFMECATVSVRVRTKHAEKTRVGLWGQSAILKAVWDVWGQNTLKRLVLVCRVSQQCLKSSRMLQNKYLNETRKTNNVAQDNEQNNVALRRQNHKRKKRNRCENHLFQWKGNRKTS